MTRASDVGTATLPSCADLVPIGVIAMKRSQRSRAYFAILQCPERTHGRLRPQERLPAPSCCYQSPLIVFSRRDVWVLARYGLQNYWVLTQPARDDTTAIVGGLQILSHFEIRPVMSSST